MYTEDEANNIECCRRPIATEDEPSTCIATGCMAWRWAEDPQVFTVLPKGERPVGDGWHPVDKPFRADMQTWVRPVDRERRGYCGLAGKP